MKQLLLTFCFFISHFILYAQGEADNWYFGNQAGLNFSSGTPVTLNNSSMNAFEGCASISDQNGDLLFYTNGIEAWNRNHTILLGATDLKGSQSSTQSSIVIPRPNNPDRYYIFTVDVNNGTDGLNYYEVDMNLDGGLGGILDPDGVPLVAPTSEKVSAVLHGNGSDIWVVTHVREENAFYIYLVTEDGVDPTPQISFTSPNLVPDESGEIGVMKFSPDGSLLAMAVDFTGSLAALFQFDSFTGTISNEIILPVANGCYGVEFSPNSQLLYATDSNQFNSQPDRLYQYDVSVYDELLILGSQSLIYESPSDIANVLKFASLQLGPDGKIYLSIFTTIDLPEFNRFLSVINSPDESGSDSNFVANQVSLGSGISRFGLPTFIQSFFIVSFTFENQCFGDQTQFFIDNNNLVSTEWNFGDPDSGSENTSTDLNPVHEFTNPGTYIVSVTATSADGKVDTFTQNVQIFDLPQPNDNVIFTVCSGSDTATFDFFGLDLLISDDLFGEVITYYETEADAIADVNVLSSPHTMQDGVLYARTRNVDTGCYAISMANVDVNSPIPLSTNARLEECYSQDRTILFTLADADPLITAETDVEITYHTTIEDAEMAQNDLGPSYNLAETIFARVENSIGCFSIAQLDLVGLSGPFANNLDLNFCSENATFPILFSDYWTQISTEENVNFSFHSSTSDAENGINEYANEYATGTEIIYVRSINQAGCFTISEIDITVELSPLVGDNQTDVLCFNYNDPNNAEVILENYNDLFSLNSGQIISYHNSEEEAINNENNITQTDVESITSNRLYWVRIANANNTCEEIRQLSLSIEQDWEVINQSETICVDVTVTPSYDLLNIALSMVQDGSSYLISFYSSATDAENSSNELQGTDTFEPQEREIVYVNFQNSNGCTLQGEISFEVNRNPDPLPTQLSDCSANGRASFNLENLRSEINPDNEDWAIQFYETLEDATLGQNELTSSTYESDQGDLTMVVTDRVTNCNSVVTIPITIFEFPTIDPVFEPFCNLTTPFAIPFTDLTALLNSSNEVQFFLSEDDALLDINALTNELEVTETQFLFARVENENCFIIEPIVLEVESEISTTEPIIYACEGEVINLEQQLEVTESGIYEIEDLTTCSVRVYEVEFSSCESLCKPQLPSAISPNGDNINDHLTIFTPQIGLCAFEVEEIIVYNRWGNLVYQGNEEWDGSQENQTQNGLFLYEIRYRVIHEDQSSELRNVSGSVLVIQ